MTRHYDGRRRSIPRVREPYGNETRCSSTLRASRPFFASPPATSTPFDLCSMLADDRHLYQVCGASAVAIAERLFGEGRPERFSYP